MSFLSPPKAPDPTQSAANQLIWNQDAAKSQQQMNMIGQAGPLGGLSWTADPNAPGGYTATQYLSPAQQQLLNLQQGAQTGIGQAAQGLGSQMAGLYGQAPQIDPTSLTNQMMKWQTQSIQPYWDIQKSNLESQLANQGLNPNDPGWQNAMMAFTKGIGQAQNQFFTQAEPLAFQQAVTQYQLPAQMEQSLLGMSGPHAPSFVSTPQENIGAPNYQQAAQNAWQAQQQQYGNMMQGLGQLFGIGGSLFGGMPGGYAGGWGGG